MSDSSKPMRKSNLELFRIISMLLIIAHHYVVNSGLTSGDGPIAANPLSVHSLFLLLFGAWGKTGINCFVLFSGFFMCKKNISPKKYLKLLCEIVFYSIVFIIIFSITGYEHINAMRVIKAFIPIRHLGLDFVSAYLVFFLFIPFLNITIHHMTEKQHIRLLALLLFTYVFLGTVPGFSVLMNYASWFMVLYFISSYIRLYPKEIFDNTKFWGCATLSLLIISSISVIVSTWLNVRLNIGLSSFAFVADSNTLLAVLLGISAFLFFKNANIPQSTFINTVASTTFGVLLIHANSDAMRQWLWRDTLDNVGYYYSSFGYFHAIASVLCVFAICSLIDYLRIVLIEKPFFKIADKWLPIITTWYNNKETEYFEKHHIE